MDEAFRALLKDRRDALATKWRDVVLDTYSPEASKFMTREADPFSNPVGHTLSRVVGECLDSLIEGADDEAMSGLVSDAMRIRAVQTFTPTLALGWLFEIKALVREEVGVRALDPGLFESLLQFETRVDALVMQAFESYLASREKIYEIKATELRRRSERVVEKLNERLAARHRDRERSERGGKQ